MHRAWNKKNDLCYYRCRFTFFRQYLSTASQLFWNFLSLKAFLVGSARAVKFHQVSLSQSTMELRKTTVMKISHSSSYLWTRTSMFPPSRPSCNQRWVLICPEGSSALIEPLLLNQSVLQVNFQTMRELKETSSLFRRHEKVSWRRHGQSIFPLHWLFSSSFGMGDISYGLIIPIYLWTLFHPVWSGRCGHKPVYKRQVWKGFVGDSDRRPTHSYHLTDFHLKVDRASARIEILHSCTNFI